MYRNTELRKLPTDALCNVVNILEIDDAWKRVMSGIPKDIHCDESGSKYNNEHIRLIEEHAKATNKKCTEILFDEWGTSGHLRPTLSTLQQILVKTQLFRAADAIADLLKEMPPQRPSDGPAAPITMNITEILNSEEISDVNSIGTKSNELCNGPTKEMKSVSDLIEFSKTYLTNQQKTNNRRTEQIKSESDFIKFSKDIPQYSMNIPDLSALIKTTKGISLRTVSYNESDTGYSVESSNTHLPDINVLQDPEVYQTSFPNIDISLGIDSVILRNENLIHFKYCDLQSMTNNFSDKLLSGPNGITGRIGSGGFGDVFVGTHPKYGILAVKKANDHLFLQRKPDIAMKVFNTEVKYLSHFKHTNIVPILGFAKDGPVPCLVCEYIDGGSLLSKIAAKILDEKQRLNIMIGTAEGLKYLHTSDKPVRHNVDPDFGVLEEIDSQNTAKNFVHGDVKSANILLTKDCVPKLCDFGLAKQYESTFVTTNPMGTSAYMAPEGIHGTITQKIDIFSFGIVLLELLTGLKPIVIDNGDKLNIKDYVRENSLNNDISKILDPVVTEWQKAKEIYTLAQNCIEYERKSRPTIVEVCDILYKINE